MSDLVSKLLGTYMIVSQASRPSIVVCLVEIHRTVLTCFHVASVAQVAILRTPLVMNSIVPDCPQVAPAQAPEDTVRDKDPPRARILGINGRLENPENQSILIT